MHWPQRWLPVLLLLLAGHASGHPMLVGVGPDLPGGVEAVAVGSDAEWDLSGWALSDGEGTVALPPLQLGPAAPLWLTNDAEGWRGLDGSVPVQTWTATGQFRLSDAGETLHLLDPSGTTVDSFAWGQGESESAPRINRTSEGLLYVRDVDWPDTDQPRDWATPRLHRVGESRLDAPTFVVNSLTLYSSPDSSHDVLSGLIASARTRLHLHVYELASLDLAHRMAEAKRATPALDLQVLVDSSPVGLTAPQRHLEAQALKEIQDAGGQVVLSGHGRYAYHHLKVLVADATVAVQSENLVESGVPRDASLGNRGWGVAVHDVALADWFAAWMASDRQAWDAEAFAVSEFDPLFEPVGTSAPRTGAYGPRVPQQTLEGEFRVRPLVSPDHTQDPRQDPVAALIDSAQVSVRVQQLDLSSGAANPIGWSSGDPLFDALARAVARGIDVQVQAAAPFSNEDDGNQPELDLLQAQGAKTSVLDRPGLLTLHNKGILVDDRIAIVGSMNGNHHSRSANREVTLVIEGPGVASWFAGVFDADWNGVRAGPDASVIGKDVQGIPWAPLPSLLAVAGVATAVRVRRR